MGLKFLGLRRQHIRPYFNGPKQPEFHYATALNIFMYMYMHHMPFQYFDYYSMSFFFIKSSGFALVSNINI